MYVITVRHSGRAKLFFVWLTIYFFSYFFGDIIASSISTDGLAYPMAWLYLPDYVKIFLAIVALIILMQVGRKLQEPFLKSAHLRAYVENSEMAKDYRFLVILLPAILTIIFRFAVLGISVTTHEILISLSSLFIIIPAMRKSSTKDIRIAKENEKEDLSFLFTTAFLLVSMFFLVKRLGGF